MAGTDASHTMPETAAQGGVDTSRTMREELTRYGIVRVPAEVFMWKGHRFTNASDALAAAKKESAE